MSQSHEMIKMCHGAFASHGSLIATLFLGGLAGGMTHCAGMCGPFVLSQTATLLDEAPLAKASEFRRMRGALLFPYHAGRLTTYALLGVLASLVSSQFRALPWFADLSAVLLVLAGVIFLFSAFPFLRALFPSVTGFVPESVFAVLRNLFAQPRGWRGYLLGLALGLLPCGFVYAALVAAAAQGDPLTAAFGMIAFALGTVPTLILVGVGGQFAFYKFRHSLRYAFPILMTMNSLTLFAMAGDLLK